MAAPSGAEVTSAASSIRRTRWQWLPGGRWAAWCRPEQQAAIDGVRGRRPRSGGGRGRARATGLERPVRYRRPRPVVGHVRDEHRPFSLIDGVLGQVTQEQAEAALHILAPGPDGAQRYREGFPAAGPEELYELVNADWLFRMPTLHLAQAHAAAGGRTHVYELTWPAPGLGGALGAFHGLDVPLVFGDLSSGQPAMLIGETPSPEAEALSAQIRAAWTAFAAHGDSGWPAYDIEQRLVQLFDTRPAVTSYPEETSRLLWQNHTFPALPLADR